MISIIITAWEEPIELEECLNRVLNQDIKQEYEIWITCPDEPTKRVVMNYKKKYPNKINFLHQPKEKGKNEMLNILSKKAKGELLIFTDGDVFFEKSTIREILKEFDNPKIGCATGRIKSSNSKKNIFGYWSHLLTDAGANNIRKERAKKGQFIELSAYLMVIRNGIIGDIPLNVAEDAIIAAIFWKKGYKIGYAENALAFVKYPNSLRDWINQKVRTAKAHETLNNYIKVPRMKSFSMEIAKGIYWALAYPKNFREFIWTLLLFPLRLYTWLQFFYRTRINKDHYGETWNKIHSNRSS